MYMRIYGREKWKDFHPGVFWGVRKWRILCFISANSPSGVGGRFFRARVNFFELPGTRKGGTWVALQATSAWLSRFFFSLAPRRRLGLGGAAALPGLSLNHFG